MSDKSFKGEYIVAKSDRTGSEEIKIEKVKSHFTPGKLLTKIFRSKRYNNKLVEKLADGDLNVEQLKEIRKAIQLGLPEKQLTSLVESNKDAKTLATLISVAVSINKR